MTPDRTPTTMRGRAARVGAIALAAAAIGAGGVIAVDAVRDDDAPAAATTTPAATTGTDTGSLAVALPGSVDFTDIYARRSAGVVSILAGTGDPQADPADPFSPGPRGGRGASQGSGVVIDEEGHVLTNEHVVSGATTVRVTFSSGTTLDAEVVGTDPSTDLALVRVDAPEGGLAPVPLGDSAALEIGEPVLAIGNPFGYAGSASVGIVSGLGRSIVSPNGFSVPDAIQTDAAVNRGNSGGALLNADGELIGVPAQIADSGVSANVGVAFAIPSDTAARVIEALKEDGAVDHAWLGVSVASVDETLQGVDGIGADAGALVTGLAQGGPAERAGLRLGDRLAGSLAGPVCAGGDVITAVEGSEVTDAASLQRAVEDLRPGAEVDLTVVGPQGEERTVTATLAERPEAAPPTTTGCR